MGFDGYEKVSVIAEDAYGIWIVEESHGYYDRHKWTICLPRALATANLGSDPVDLVQVAIWESNAGPPNVIARLKQWMTMRRERLLPHSCHHITIRTIRRDC